MSFLVLVVGDLCRLKVRDSRLAHPLILMEEGEPFQLGDVRGLLPFLLEG
jgi:hypothetical protein